MLESGYYLKYLNPPIPGKIKIMCSIRRILWLKKIGYPAWATIKNVIEVFFYPRSDVQ